MSTCAHVRGRAALNAEISDTSFVVHFRSSFLVGLASSNLSRVLYLVRYDVWDETRNTVLTTLWVNQRIQGRLEVERLASGWEQETNDTDRTG